MRKNVVAVHYNTPALLGAAIRSLEKHTPGCHVVVFDNSDHLPFSAVGSTCQSDIEIIDNTYGRFVDFERWLSTFTDKAPSVDNNYASAKHCRSVDVCFDLLSDGFVLMDSDVLIKKDITPFFDTRYAWSGRVKSHNSRYGIRLPRVLPFLCYLNVPMLLNAGVRYCNDLKMYGLSRRVPDMGYDTGCWLYEDCVRKHLPGKEINIDDYVEHLGHASWKDKDVHSWLEERRALWE